jgi:hypothetical protein
VHFEYTRYQSAGHMLRAALLIQPFTRGPAHAAGICGAKIDVCQPERQWIVLCWTTEGQGYRTVKGVPPHPQSSPAAVRAGAYLQPDRRKRQRQGEAYMKRGVRVSKPTWMQRWPMSSMAWHRRAPLHLCPDANFDHSWCCAGAGAGSRLEAAGADTGCCPTHCACIF